MHTIPASQPHQRGFAYIANSIVFNRVKRQDLSRQVSVITNIFRKRRSLFSGDSNQESQCRVHRISVWKNLCNVRLLLPCPRNMSPFFRRFIPSRCVPFSRRPFAGRLAQAPCEPGDSAAEFRRSISGTEHSWTTCLAKLFRPEPTFLTCRLFKLYSARGSSCIAASTFFTKFPRLASCFPGAKCITCSAELSLQYSREYWWLQGRSARQT